MISSEFHFIDPQVFVLCLQQLRNIFFNVSLHSGSSNLVNDKIHFALNFLSLQWSFKGESLILKWTSDSTEKLGFNLFCKQENDKNWSDVVLKNVSKNDSLGEYKVEHTVLNVQPGEYIFQIQGKSDSGVSKKSEERESCREEKASLAFLFIANVI